MTIYQYCSCELMGREVEFGDYCLSIVRAPEVHCRTLKFNSSVSLLIGAVKPSEPRLVHCGSFQHSVERVYANLDGIVPWYWGLSFAPVSIWLVWDIDRNALG